MVWYWSVSPRGAGSNPVSPIIILLIGKKKEKRKKMLVCGFSGLNVESLKVFRKEIKEIGFNCKVAKGKLCIETNDTQSNWESLMGKLKKEKKIIPFYYIEQEGGVAKEYATVKYFEESIKSPFNAGLVLKPLLSVLHKLWYLKVSGIVMNKNMKEN